MRNIAEDYAAYDPRLAGRFAAPLTRLSENAPERRRWDSALVADIRCFNEKLGNRVDFTGGEAVIVTGQQPGIFGGPLYTVYKAITAVRLAERLTQRFGQRVVPLFWIAGDDHDFEEARHTAVLTKTHEMLSLRYDPQDRLDGFPLYRIRCGDTLHALVEQMAAHVPSAEFGGEIRQFLHDSISESASLAEWTGRILTKLFAGAPLVLFAPHLPSSRALAVPIVERELERPGVVSRLLADAGCQLEQLGYTAQLDKEEDVCHFFLEIEGRRRRLRLQAGGYYAPEEDRSFSRQELEAILRDEPGRFSLNVALRCVLQQRLFPAAAYVAGPGELAYWAQLKPVFEHFDETAPVIYPRARAALTTLKLDKLLDKLGLTLDELYAGPDALLDRVLEASAASPALRALREKKSSVLSVLESVASASGRERAAGAVMMALRERVVAAWERAEYELLRADEAKTAAARKQVDRLCAALAPGRKPQERVYTIFSFLFEHGWKLIERLTEELDIDSFRLQRIQL